MPEKQDAPLYEIEIGVVVPALICPPIWLSDDATGPYSLSKSLLISSCGSGGASASRGVSRWITCTCPADARSLRLCPPE
jgi:hypothetical protein